MNKRGKLADWLIASAFLVVFLATGCASRRTADLQADYPEERAQIERCLQGVLVATENKDFDRLDGYHLDKTMRDR